MSSVIRVKKKDVPKRREARRKQEEKAFDVPEKVDSLTFLMRSNRGPNYTYS